MGRHTTIYYSSVFIQCCLDICRLSCPLKSPFLPKLCSLFSGHTHTLRITGYLLSHKAHLVRIRAIDDPHARMVTASRPAKQTLKTWINSENTDDSEGLKAKTTAPQGRLLGSIWVARFSFKISSAASRSHRQDARKVIK